MAQRGRLTALILARNEEQRLGACLAHVLWADEILVIDNLSTDRTAAIARHYGATVLQRPLDTFAGQANFGLGHATGDWVLSLDADEIVTPALRAAIERVLIEGSPHAGFTFKRLNFFLGRRMRYGGWYHDVLHFFRRTAGQFEGGLHHTPVLSGSIGRLPADVEHRPFQAVSQFVQRQNWYSSVEAEDLWAQHGAEEVARARYEIHRKPLKLFWKMYVKKQGFREGFHGLLFSILYSWLHLVRWAKYQERCEAASATAAGARPVQDAPKSALARG